jgi:transcriptional regulator with XRE-family HTH domain
MDVRLRVGLNFRALRMERDLTQEQAAELTGVSQQYISGLERGRRNPTVLTLHELSGPLGVEPSELLRSD